MARSDTMNPDNEQALAVCAVCSADVQAHHRLIRDDSGKRLAKRDDARAIALYRAQGASPAAIVAMVFGGG